MATGNVNLWTLTVIYIWISLRSSHGAVYDLYNTKIATSDLGWTIEPRNSWEEVSGFGRNGEIIRSYQVCETGKSDSNNWARSPFISTRGASTVNVDIEFSVTKCDWENAGDYCRQTFNLFYYWSERDVASSTFPPWQERSYTKIDTVAANSNNQINKKTFTITNLKKTGGIYIAAQDQGACMSLISLKVYYYYCKETIRSLTNFPETMIGTKPASLINVKGKCIANAEVNGGQQPVYYCGSTGEWQIMTGSCKCKAGFHPNGASTACLPCPIGYFKSDAGNARCIECPANSGPLPEEVSSPSITRGGSSSIINLPTEGLSACPCHPGYARAQHESASKACTRIPSAPTFSMTRVNATSVYVAWETPVDLGNRDDLYYSFACETCDVGKKNCRDCPETVSYSTQAHGFSSNALSLQSITKYSKNDIEITNLEPYTNYLFKIFARNGVSGYLKEKDNYLLVEIETKESVPPAVTNIYVKNTSFNSVNINWQSPRKPAGKILGYEVEVVRRYTIFKFDLKPRKQEKPVVVQTAKTSCTLENLNSDTDYHVRIRAKTAVGFGEYSAAVAFKTSKDTSEMEKTEDGSNSGLLIVAVAVIIALVVVCALLVYYYKRRSRARAASKSATAFSHSFLNHTKPGVVMRKQSNHQNQTDSNRTTYVDYPDPKRAVLNMNKEVSPLNLQLHNTIGEGEFAVVYKATMMDGDEMKTVAAKQLKDSAGVKDQSNFLREACTMAQFDHPNILQLKGVIIKHKPEMIISEFMENGSLYQFLKDHEGSLSVHQLVHMLHGIANGMKYLSEMQFVHRDLAARNILVDSNGVCKVADFGLSRTLENDPHATYTTQGGKIALRWTAPECIRFREFTSASDVWSFGIVMWEVMSYGEKPYWNMTNNEVMQSIANGMRLPAPTGCPKALHELMLECWYLDPIRRPSFSKIVSDLNRFLRHSSLLQIREEDEMEQEVCRSPDDDGQGYGPEAESFLEHSQTRRLRDSEGYARSESSSISQDDTCSSVLVTDERCLNV